jgi:dTDP-4-amino-4,6-dideoxygalactose transaminase
MFKIVEDFENKVADFFGAPYAVATDCCTHAIELSLRHQKVSKAICPSNTYISIPFTLEKLNIEWSFDDRRWSDYYCLGNTNVIDAAVFWQRNGYIPNTLMCLSFQYKKHLNLGRGGMILTDDKETAIKLKKMSYDGRSGDAPWMLQDIDTIGYHYYMTPETAQIGLDKFQEAASTIPKQWSYRDYPHLPDMKVFQ